MFLVNTKVVHAAGEIKKKKKKSQVTLVRGQVTTVRGKT